MQDRTNASHKNDKTGSPQIKPNPLALLPIAIFLVIYLGHGIFFEYIRPVEGQMGFYIMSVVVAFGIALIVAFLQNRSLTFDEKIHLCAEGIGDDNITTMLLIFLLAGAFSGIAKATGGAVSVANMLLNVIPSRFAVSGLFIIACLISMAMGTSVGTITLLFPSPRRSPRTAGSRYRCAWVRSSAVRCSETTSPSYPTPPSPPRGPRASK